MEPEYKEVKELTRVGYEFMIDPFGAKRWFLDGELHREGGPAYEDDEGYKEWYLNGLYHREDGPAIEYPPKNGGGNEWWLKNYPVPEEKFKEVWECPMDRLPLYINTVFAPIAKRRLSKNESNQTIQG